MVTVDPYDAGEPYTVEVTRSRREGTHVREYRPPAVAELSPGVVYVDLTRVPPDSFDRVIERLQEAEGLIFDLRGYPHAPFTPRLLPYLSEEPLVFDSLYVPLVAGPDGTATQLVRSNAVWRRPVASEEQLTDIRVFIVNGNGTKSFAEAILGLIEKYDLGERVGQPSAGANGAIVRLRLPDRYYTSWTGAKVVRPDGSPLFTVGIPPTVPAHRTIDGVAARRDELLEQAYEVLTGEEAETMEIRELLVREE